MCKSNELARQREEFDKKEQLRKKCEFYAPPVAGTYHEHLDVRERVMQFIDEIG